MNIEQKKSAVDLTELALGIVILGIVVSIGAVILNKVADGQITNAASYTIANETVAITTSGTQVANVWGKSVGQVTNSSGILISAPNYTVTVNSDSGALVISNSTCVAVNSLCVSPWKVSYDVYNTSDPRYSLPNNATIGLAEYGNWFKILVIVGIASVVLALIFMAFGRGSTGGSSSGGVSY